MLLDADKSESEPVAVSIIAQGFYYCQKYASFCAIVACQNLVFAELIYFAVYS